MSDIFRGNSSESTCPQFNDLQKSRKSRKIVSVFCEQSYVSRTVDYQCRRLGEVGHFEVSYGIQHGIQIGEPRQLIKSQLGRFFGSVKLWLSTPRFFEEMEFLPKVAIQVAIQNTQTFQINFLVKVEGAYLLESKSTGGAMEVCKVTIVQ